MKTSYVKPSESLIISRLQQIEIATIKSSMSVDSPYFHLITVANQQPFFDNLPINMGVEFYLLGNKILNVQLTRGYLFQDLEFRLSTLTPANAILAVGRLNLSFAIFYQTALVLAFLRLYDRPLDEKSAEPYGIGLEFARIAHHLNVIKNVALSLDLDNVADIAEDCANILHAPCELFSKIFEPQDAPINRLVKSDITDILADALARSEELSTAINAEEKIWLTLHKKAVITLSQAGSWGLTGSYLRANQDLYDLRRNAQCALPYAKAPRISTREGGDAWARFSLRPMEMVASLRWLKQILNEGSTRHLNPLVLDHNFCLGPAKMSSAIGEVEGPEGDIKMSIFVDKNNQRHFRIRTPAYFIAQAIPYMLTNLDLDDVAVLLFSLGITAEEIDK